MNKTEARERLERLLAVVDELPEEAEILLLECCSPGDTGDGPAILLFRGLAALCKARKVRARRVRSEHRLVYHTVCLRGVRVQQIVHEDKKTAPGETTPEAAGRTSAHKQDSYSIDGPAAEVKPG